MIAGYTFLKNFNVLITPKYLRQRGSNNLEGNGYKKRMRQFSKISRTKNEDN